MRHIIRKLRKVNWTEWMNDPVHGIGSTEFICTLVVIEVALLQVLGWI